MPEGAGLEEAHAKAVVRAGHRSMAEGAAAKEHVITGVAALRASLQTPRADVRALRLKTAAGVVSVNAGITITLVKLLP